MNSAMKLVVVVAITIIGYCCSTPIKVASLVRRSLSESPACTVQTMEMKIYEPGCGTKTIESKGCHGYCPSSSMYTNGNGDLSVNCRFCKVKEHVLRNTTLSCPLLPIKTKLVLYREAVSCECGSCRWWWKLGEKFLGMNGAFVFFFGIQKTCVWFDCVMETFFCLGWGMISWKSILCLT